MTGGAYGIGAYITSTTATGNGCTATPFNSQLWGQAMANQYALLVQTPPPPPKSDQPDMRLLLLEDL